MCYSAYRRVWKVLSIFLCITTFLLLPGVEILCLTNAGQDTSPVKETFQITNIRAFLYYHGKGEFSQQDVLSGQMALWNVIIGAGDADAPSRATLVLVAVKAPSRPDRNFPAVRLTVKYANRTTLDHEVSLSSFANGQMTLQVPFLIYNTGCERLQITAALRVGTRVLNSLSRTAEFKCGE